MVCVSAIYLSFYHRMRRRNDMEHTSNSSKFNFFFFFSNSKKLLKMIITRNKNQLNNMNLNFVIIIADRIECFIEMFEIQIRLNWMKHTPPSSHTTPHNTTPHNTTLNYSPPLYSIPSLHYDIIWYCFKIDKIKLNII